MNRKLVFIIIGLIVIGLAVFFYVDTVFLPVHFKRFVITRAERFLHRPVAIDVIDIKPMRGFIVENITIGQKDNPEKPFIHIRQLTFNILIIPLFQQRAVIIPNIRIKDPFIDVSRHENGEWNFSDLSNRKKTSARKNIPSVLLRKLSIENGEMDYTDETRAKEFTESVKNINVHTTLSLNKGIRFVAEAQVPEKNSTITMKGNHSLMTGKLTAQILLTNIHLARYLPLFQSSRPYVNLDDGIIPSADLAVIYKRGELQARGAFSADHANIRIGESKHITGTIGVTDMLLTWHGGKWDAKGRVQIPSIRMTAASGQEFRGDLDAVLNLLTISGENVTSQGDVTINNAYLTIDADTFLKGTLTAVNASLSQLNDTIRLQGDMDMKDAFVSINSRQSLQGDFSTTDTQWTWSSPDDKGNRRFDAQGGLKIDSAHIILGTGRSLDGNISAQTAALMYDHKKMTIEAQGQIHQANLRVEENRQFQGNPQFDIFYQQDPKKTTPTDYKGIVRLTKGQLTGMPILDKINDIEGIITVLPDQAQTEKLTFHTQETDIRLSGLLTNFAKPSLDIKASAQNVRWQTILSLFPSLRKKIKADVTGHLDVKGTYKGSARSPADATVKLQAQVAGTRISHKSLPGDITDVSGRLDYKNDLAAWHNLRARYKDKTYILTGQLSNFSRPVIDTKITADQLTLTTRVKILHQAFRLTSFVGDYLNSHFDLKGDVHFSPDTPADIDLRGKFALNLEDIGTLVPRLSDKAGQFHPSGILEGEGIYQGKFNDWRDWKLTFNAASDEVKILDYPLRHLSVRYAQRDRTVSKCEISSTLYDGGLKIDSSADLRGREAPFQTTIRLDHLNLKQLREDRKPKNQYLAGILSLSADLRGMIGRWRDLTGEGALSVTDGYLWHWNILNGISGILLIPEFKSLVFTEARGDFSIYGRKIHTENARMTSQTTTLDGKGWIDFEKNLNFNITPTFSELTLLRSNSLKKGPTSILTQTDGYINIKLTGTLDNPHTSVEKFPIKIIEETIGGTTGTLKEVIGSILDEIF